MEYRKIKIKDKDNLIEIIDFLLDNGYDYGGYCFGDKERSKDLLIRSHDKYDYLSIDEKNDIYSSHRATDEELTAGYKILEDAGFWDEPAKEYLEIEEPKTEHKTSNKSLNFIVGGGLLIIAAAVYITRS